MSPPVNASEGISGRDSEQSLDETFLPGDFAFWQEADLTVRMMFIASYAIVLSAPSTDRKP